MSQLHEGATGHAGQVESQQVFKRTHEKRGGEEEGDGE